MTHPPSAARRSPRARRRGERGSAFVIALLVLLVLTIAGLALTLMTQTEVKIGANEREANRTFYAADSGINVSTARTLWAQNDKTLTILLNTTQQDTGVATAPPLTFFDQIVVTPLYPVYTAPANLSQINQNQQTTYVTTVNLVNATSTRTGQDAAYTQAMAQKVIGSMIGLQPRDKASGIVYHPSAVAGNLKY